MKQVIWTLVAVVVVGGLAWPKVKPLLLESAKQEAGEPKAGDKAADKSADKNAGGEKQGDKGAAGGKHAPPLRVATYQVKPVAYAETVNATGTLRADEGVELQAETSGKVVKINFAEGKPVKQGALLVKLNDEDLQANLRRFTHAKELAELQEQRYAKLLQQKVITQNDYDTALNNVQTQQAQIDLYKALIVKTEIRAPFDGVVGLRYVSPGAYVNATGATSTRIATLQRLDKLKVDFAIPEKYAGRVRVGNPITFSIAGDGRQHSGRIFAIDPRIDTGTRTLLLRAVVPNNQGILLPGAFANVTVTTDELPDAILLPSEAVIPGLDEKNVFVMKDGKAERRAVQTGSRTTTQVHILSGLRTGEVVITSGLQQLRAGQEVIPMDKAQGKGTGNDADKSGERKPGITGQHKSAKLAGAL